MAQPNKENVIPICHPKVGQKFTNLDDAWLFWVNYGGHAGFEVRKRSSWTSKMDGKVTSCRYVCAKEGRRAQDKRDHLTKNPRAETRTSCDVRMCLSLDRVAGHYDVVDVMLDHNHVVYLPETFHLMLSQRKISDLQAFEIEAADDSGIRPRAAHELASRTVGGRMNLSYTCRDQKNHLQSRRQRELEYGQAGSMLKYFQDKISENPSFQYTTQLDCEEQITNIFWADAKMCIDYAHFGDVVTFDTTFGTNKEYRPFGVFIGLNQFRETVIFGAALLFDETRGSFKWLFEAFLAAHGGKQPRTIFTDQDTAMGKAVEDVFTEAWHGLCTYHIMQNAVKNLCNSKDEESNSQKNEEDDEPHILLDFSACMYNIEDKAAFEEAFEDGDNTFAVAVLRDDGDLSSEMERIVVGDPQEQTASCSCFQFRRTGVLCGHALKVLDLMNIKLLPNHYLVKRWTREARHGTIKDIKGRNIIENPKLETMLRYKFLSHKFHDFAYKAASDPECSMLVDNALDCVAKQVEDKMGASTSILSDSSNAQLNVQQDDSLLTSARLKKKDVQPKSSKRHRSWLDKTRKFKKKAPKNSKQQDNRSGETQQQDNGSGETQQQENGRAEIRVPTENANNDSNAFTSFTDLLMGSREIDDMYVQGLL